MHKIGIHLSYWQESWSDELIPIFDRVKTAGFDVAELPLLNPRIMDFSSLAVGLEQAGLLPSCGTGLGPETDITSPDQSIRAAGIDHLRACLEGAARLGSPILGGVTYAPWGFFPDDNRVDRRTRCIESLGAAADYAASVGVVLCIEVLNRFEGYLLNTVDQGLALLAEVGSPGLKLHLDTFHMNIEEDNLPDAILRAGGRLGHFHCVANNRKAPGDGHLDWGAIRSALKAIGYYGYLVAESFVNPVGEVGHDLFIWRQLSGDLDKNAARIAKFIKNEVAFGF